MAGCPLCRGDRQAADPVFIAKRTADTAVLLVFADDLDILQTVLQFIVVDLFAHESSPLISVRVDESNCFISRPDNCCGEAISLHQRQEAILCWPCLTGFIFDFQKDGICIWAKTQQVGKAFWKQLHRAWIFDDISILGCVFSLPCPHLTSVTA